MGEQCLSPSGWGATPLQAAKFGKWAERRIGSDYLTHVGRSNWCPVNMKDFSDFSAGWKNIDIFLYFVKDNNPGKIGFVDETALRTTAGLIRCPDLMTHDSLARRFEYYEIKPSSPTGNVAGRTKMAALDAMFAYFKLPYRGGTRWQPQTEGKYSLGKTSVLGTNFDLYFYYWNDGGGLIFYEICAKGEFDEVVHKMSLGIAIVTILLVALYYGPALVAA
jgi:hypothetical protein